MQVYHEVSPYRFLMEESWNCDELKSAVTAAGLSDLDFDVAIEDFFSETIVSVTKLNDFFRFHANEVLVALGIRTNEED